MSPIRRLEITILGGVEMASDLVPINTLLVLEVSACCTWASGSEDSAKSGPYG
jgi:hypothetical protein